LIFHSPISNSSGNQFDTSNLAPNPATTLNFEDGWPQAQNNLAERTSRTKEKLDLCRKRSE